MVVRVDSVLEMSRANYRGHILLPWFVSIQQCVPQHCMLSLRWCIVWGTGTNPRHVTTHVGLTLSQCWKVSVAGYTNVPTLAVFCLMSVQTLARCEHVPTKMTHMLVVSCCHVLSKLCSVRKTRLTAAINLIAIDTLPLVNDSHVSSVVGLRCVNTVTVVTVMGHFPVM